MNYRRCGDSRAISRDNIGSIGPRNGCVSWPREIRRSRMLFSSIAANRRLRALESLAAERVVATPETSWQTFRNGILPRGPPASRPFPPGGATSPDERHRRAESSCTFRSARGGRSESSCAPTRVSARACISGHTVISAGRATRLARSDTIIYSYEATSFVSLYTIYYIIL